MNKTISFKHSGNAGDIIYALAGIKQVYASTGSKADIYLWLDRQGHYYQGAQHPLGNVMLNKYMYKMLKPLLEAQPYVNSVSKFKGEKIIADLNLIRTRDIGMPYGNIAKWYAYIFPDMNTDLSRPWIHVDTAFEYLQDKILLNRTSRYRNPNISYAFLRNRSDVLYVGTKEEYKEMRKEIKNLTYLEVSDFLQLAVAIKSCKFFIGNQSMCFGLAEAMKVPRILEVCSFAPNVIPAGPGPAYDYYSQQAFEYYVDELSKGKPTQVKENLFDKRLLETAKELIEEGQLSPKDVQSLKKSEPSIEDKLQMSEFRNEPINESWHPGTDVTKNTLVDFPRLSKIKEYVQETEKLKTYFGAMAEVGVYKGGTALLIRKNTTRDLYLFDTFEGMPETEVIDSGHNKGDFADTSLEKVKELLILNHPPGQTSHGPTFINKGIFPETTKNLPSGQIFCFVHIDCDIYKSVKDSLEYFYPRMIKGGIICLDDVLEPGCPGAKKAFEEFMIGKPEEKGLWEQYMVCQSQVAFRKL